MKYKVDYIKVIRNGMFVFFAGEDENKVIEEVILYCDHYKVKEHIESAKRWENTILTYECNFEAYNRDLDFTLEIFTSAIEEK